MINDIYNENKGVRKITNENQIILINNIKLTKKLLLNNLSNENNEMPISKESTSRTIISNYEFMNKYKIKSEKKLSIPFSEVNSSKSSIRKDNFGNEIKKGGKQKIAFADEIKVVDSLFENNKNNKLKNNRKKNFPSSKCLFEDILSINKIKERSLTPKSSKSSLIKIINNIYKYNINKKYFEDLLVNVIKIESTKKETKLNTFFMNNRNNIEEEQQVCCSCYCSIL